MATSTQESGLQRNLALFPWYMALFQAYCWLPVFFLFFLSQLPIEKVIWLESIFFLSVVILEVPSGYFSDKIGRRTTIIFSAIGIVLAHSLFLYGSNTDEPFFIFALAQVFLAVGTSFKSGTDTSLHFDSLSALDRQSEYPEREAIASRNGFLSGAAAALVGGILASIELRYAYAASLLVGIITLLLAIRFVEPMSMQTRKTVSSFSSQITKSIAQLANPSLAWLFAFFVLMIILNHVPYEFYQPYIGLLGDSVTLIEGSTPLTTGVHTALTMVVASWVAGRSIRLRNYIGLWPTLLLAALIQVCSIAAMSHFLHPVIALLLIVRSTPRALMTAPLNGAITPLLPQAQRATYLSIQSLVGRLSFAGLLATLPLMTDGAGSDWLALSQMLQICTVLGIVGIVMLVIMVRKIDLTGDISSQANST